MRLVDGAIVQSHSVEIKAGVEEDKRNVLIHAILDLRHRLYSDSKEIIIPFEIDEEIPNVKISIPQRGDKKSLIELSERNAKFFMLDTKKRRSLVDPERHSKRILNTLQKDLRLKNYPNHIECFDNSNIQGDYAVAACVVFKNAKPSKKDYRHFNIKTVEGPDDYGSMIEIVKRRYQRLLNEKKSLPQLIIIDGGKGQLNAAVKALESLNLRGRIAIIGIAKRLEEIYFPGDKFPLYLDKTSESLKLIQHARDEAHRFGITHYRKKHQKEMKKTELESISGIGAKTADQLLKKYKSIKRIKELNKEDLIKEIGQAKASLVFDYFKMEK
jgi:excinuclease ABC subunit C